MLYFSCDVQFQIVESEMWSPKPSFWILLCTLVVGYSYVKYSPVALFSGIGVRGWESWRLQHAWLFDHWNQGSPKTSAPFIHMRFCSKESCRKDGTWHEDTLWKLLSFLSKIHIILWFCGGTQLWFGWYEITLLNIIMWKAVQLFCPLPSSQGPPDGTSCIANVCLG